MTERVADIEIGKLGGYTEADMQLLATYADLLPNLLAATGMEHDLLELRHLKIVEECIDKKLLDEICSIRDRFKEMLDERKIA